MSASRNYLQRLRNANSEMLSGGRAAPLHRGQSDPLPSPTPPPQRECAHPLQCSTTLFCRSFCRSQSQRVVHHQRHHFSNSIHFTILHRATWFPLLFTKRNGSSESPPRSVHLQRSHHTSGDNVYYRCLQFERYFQPCLSPKKTNKHLQQLEFKCKGQMALLRRRPRGQVLPPLFV